MSIAGDIHQAQGPGFRNVTLLKVDRIMLILTVIRLCLTKLGVELEDKAIPRNIAELLRANWVLTLKGRWQSVLKRFLGAFETARSIWDAASMTGILIRAWNLSRCNTSQTKITQWGWMILVIARCNRTRYPEGIRYVLETCYVSKVVCSI